MNTWNLFNKALGLKGVKGLANSLSIHQGTVKRWLLLEQVPDHYWFDFARILDINVDYESFSAKEKDQFFTDPVTAVTCFTAVHDVLISHDVNLSEYTFIEPSAGDGSFFNLLPPSRRIGIDIEPRHPEVISHDFLTWKPPPGKYICIGNPPFGLRGHLALQFIQRASEYCDYVCFILPQLFNSNGKGSCKSRLTSLGLLHSMPINNDFHYPDGTSVTVNSVFQIWSKYHQTIEDIPQLPASVRLVSLSDGGTPATTRNKSLHGCCDFYLPSTVFGKSNMHLYSSFDELPGRKGYGILIDNLTQDVVHSIEAIDWSEVAFVSTNNAYNLRFDLIAKSLIQSSHLLSD
jgi:hypothetical protein